MNRDALAYLEVSRFGRQTCRRAVMDNTGFLSQGPAERQSSVEDDTSDGCNNAAAAHLPTPKIQAVRLRNHYAETLRNKQNVTSDRQVQQHVPHNTYPAPSLSRRLVVGKHARAIVDCRRCF